MNPQLLEWIKYVLAPDRCIGKFTEYSLDWAWYIKHDLAVKVAVCVISFVMNFIDMHEVPLIGADNVMWSASNSKLTTYYMLYNIGYVELFDFCKKVGIPFAHHEIHFTTKDGDVTTVTVQVDRIMDKLDFCRDGVTISTDDTEILNISTLYNKLCQN